MLRLIELMLAALNADSRIQAWQSLNDLPKPCRLILKNYLECPRLVKSLLDH
jgi:hypothetical protein